MNNRPKVKRYDWETERASLRLDLIIAVIAVMLYTTILVGIVTCILTDAIERRTAKIDEPAQEPILEETTESVPSDISVEQIIEQSEPSKSKLPATEAEIELLALVTMAEAEGESEEGKRLVIDTILNRVDSDRWPDTISAVIYQPNQFTSMWNGRVERCHVTDEVRQLVVEELLSRTNSEVVYFTAGGYGRYGTPAFQVGNHYFCT